MHESVQLTVRRELLEGLSFPDGFVTVHIIKHRRREYEEAAVDPAAVPLGFFAKAGNAPILERQGAESSRSVIASDKACWLLLPAASVTITVKS